MARTLDVPGAEGDATLRSMMDWGLLEGSIQHREILAHWQKLGRFRRDHPAIGAGRHKDLGQKPYVFARSFVHKKLKDEVIVALDLAKGPKSISVAGVFKDGTRLLDRYSNTPTVVRNGQVSLDTPFDILLLETSPSP